MPLASTPLEQVHRAALLASVTGQCFEDVKFFAFSRRTQSGSVNTPLPLFANSTMIRKASSHFDYVFAAGFSESSILDMNAAYPPTKPSTTDCYDYESDSDLEDEERDESPTHSVDSPEGRREQQKEGSEKGILDNLGIQGEDDAKQTGVPSVSKPGRVVFLDDIAYNTWKAFIFYTYFHELDFAPLKSEHKTRPGKPIPVEIPTCSPKSMYRLAEKYDIVSLKARAADAIKARLSPHNILEEIFSSFTCLYPGIQAIESEYLHANIKDQGIQARLPLWVEAMEDGRLPKGAAAIITSLLTKLATPSPPAPGMRGCPNASCTASSYYCQSCGRTF
ncbi:hypothetical protein C8Q74DRAFT_1199511 [Fomes fomentarius]|nr:hypothetical protein C8Q74DRAFT_1199511 [Fomes fomentarius]